MRRERAEKFVYEYMSSEIAEDLDESQIEVLTNRVAANFSDKVIYLSPHEVAKFAKDFQEEKTVNTTRVVPRRQPDPESLDETIRSVMRESNAYWCLEDATAFLAPIRDKILAARETVYYSPQGLARFIDAAELPIKGAIENALSSGWSSSNYQRFQAGDKFVLQTFRREGHPDPESTEAWRGIINILGREQGWALNQNGVNASYDAVAAKAKAAILRGGKFPVWSASHGQIRWHDASELDALGPDELTATITAARDLYQRMGESRDQQRERLQDLADTAAGVRKFREGDVDSLSGQVQFKQSSPNNAYEFVGDGHSQSKPNGNPKMDRSVPVPANLPPHITQLFTDPLTGKFFTKTALHKLARTNTKLFRRMMNSRFIEFMNSLLAQPE